MSEELNNDLSEYQKRLSALIKSNVDEKKFYLNTFFPSSGSSLNTIHAKDKLWNFTRKFITGNLNKQFKSIEVITETLDNYCKRNNIKSIDVLKIDT